MAGDLVFDDHDTTEQWNRVTEIEFSELQRARATGRRTLLDHYGGINKAEFFAVASETFFERPHRLKQSHRELFDLLVKYYRIDPATWNVTDGA